jgi:geranylgeranyl reductase family protein
VIRCDAVIAGGGPAGSTCARILGKAGWHVIVLDRARFPRDKVCAGWVTPGVFEALELDPAEYGATGLTLQEITAFRTGFLERSLVETRYPRVVSYAIRRCEFDDFLLRRAQVCVRDGTPAASLERRKGTWIVNGGIQAPVVVGAGGHFCPVARRLSVEAAAVPPVVAKEAEFRIEPPGAAVPEPPELFFCRDLEGYGWCVRKGEYLNVGIGRRTKKDFDSHVRHFMAFIDGRYRVSSTSRKWRGHAYLAAGTGQRALVSDGLMLVGDAAGLAYPESGEGIRPAVESGRLAADVLVRANGRYGAGDLQPYVDEMRRQHPPSVPRQGLARTLSASLAGLLLRSPAFTRHVVLDRWFLRRVGMSGGASRPG